MFYLVERRAFGLDQRCDNDSEDGIPICSLWDTFHMTYLIIIGESFFDSGGGFNGNIRSAIAVVSIVAIFSGLALLMILHLISSSIDKKTRNSMEISVNMFWAPMMTFVFLLRDVKQVICCQRGLSNNGNRRDCFLSFEMILESRWEFLSASFSNGDLRNTKWWYLQDSRSSIFANKWIIRSLALIIMPIWICLGLI